MNYQELQILSELDSRQYGLLKLAATENCKKRALVFKVKISAFFHTLVNFSVFGPSEINLDV